METSNENVIEFLRGQKTATVTFCSNSRLNSRVRKISEERPDECQIVHENTDGSIVAHLPAKWIKINPSKIYTEEEKEKLLAQFAKGRIQIEDDEDEEEDE